MTRNTHFKSLDFAADESRWIRRPSSALIIREKLGAKISYAKRFI